LISGTIGTVLKNSVTLRVGLELSNRKIGAPSLTGALTRRLVEGRGQDQTAGDPPPTEEKVRNNGQHGAEEELKQGSVPLRVPARHRFCLPLHDIQGRIPLASLVYLMPAAIVCGCGSAVLSLGFSIFSVDAAIRPSELPKSGRSIIASRRPAIQKMHMRKERDKA
jgi:hypothetical protein